MKHSSITNLSFLCITLSNVRWATAIEARPVPFTVVQPTGETIWLMGRGDENDNEIVDMDGYLVLENDLSEFVYADELEDGEVVASQEVVGKARPSSKQMKKGLHKNKDCFKNICGGAPGIEEYKHKSSKGGRRTKHRRASTSGKLKNLVVLMYFKDHAADRRAVPRVEDIEILMNADEPDPDICPTGSLKSAYMEMSYGQLEIESTVAPWVVTQRSESWYADGRSGSTNLHDAIRDTLTYLDENGIVDFSEFDEDDDGFIDAITILHSGYSAEWGGQDCDGQRSANRIWSHKWSLYSNSNGDVVGPWRSQNGVAVYDYHISPALWGTCGSEIGRLGVIAHETGHFLGLDDYYDKNGGGRGLGGYCLMSSSWGFDYSQRYPGILSAYSRLLLGWDFPKVPNLGINWVASAEEPSSDPQIYMIGEEFGFRAGEYLLIENRQKKGLDLLLPEGGLAIYHIDENAGLSEEGYPGDGKWPENGKHYRVALLQADGLYHLERGINKGGKRDFFRGDRVAELLSSDVPSDGPFPNTDSYQNGNVYQTGVEIFEISVSGDNMSFQFYHPNALPAIEPTSEPSNTPSLFPSVRPTNLRSDWPSSSPSVDTTWDPTNSSLPSIVPTNTTSPTATPTSSPTFEPTPYSSNSSEVSSSLSPTSYTTSFSTTTPTLIPFNSSAPSMTAMLTPNPSVSSSSSAPSRSPIPSYPTTLQPSMEPSSFSFNSSDSSLSPIPTYTVTTHSNL